MKKYKKTYTKKWFYKQLDKNGGVNDRNGATILLGSELVEFAKDWYVRAIIDKGNDVEICGEYLDEDGLKKYEYEKRFQGCNNISQRWDLERDEQGVYESLVIGKNEYYFWEEYIIFPVNYEDAYDIWHIEYEREVEY